MTFIEDEAERRTLDRKESTATSAGTAAARNGARYEVNRNSTRLKTLPREVGLQDVKTQAMATTAQCYAADA